VAAGIFFVGTLFLGGGGIYVGLGILMNGFWANHIGDASNAPAWYVFGAIMMVLVLILNYLGVRLAIRAMLTFAAVSFIPMLFLAGAIIVKGGADGNTLQVFNPGQTSLFGVTGGGVLGGILLGILLFVGFEAAASIGEESSDPHKSIPRAVLATVAASSLFFVIMAYAISIGYGKAAVSKGAWAADPAALNTMATEYVGRWLGTIIDLVVILDATALALAICVAIGRGYFALGRDGLLPSAFAKTSRHNTPWVGNLVIVVGCAFLFIVSQATSLMDRFVPIFGSKEFATFIVSATAGSFAIEIVYLLLAIGGLVLLRRFGGAWWVYLVVIVAILTPLLGFYGALKPDPHSADNYNWMAFYWSLVVVVISLVWFAVVKMVRPENVKNAAQHAAEHHGVAPLDSNLDFTPAPPDTTI
jgi:amino acid transporter